MVTAKLLLYMKFWTSNCPQPQKMTRVFFFFNFFFYLWWILSYIEMKQPWVYMCPPSRSPLPTRVLKSLMDSSESHMLWYLLCGCYKKEAKNKTWSLCCSSSKWISPTTSRPFLLVPRGSPPSPLTEGKCFVTPQQKEGDKNIVWKRSHEYKEVTLNKNPLLIQIVQGWGLPGGPVAKTLCSQGRGLGFNSWSGN